jgi:hypothetical protein
MKAEIASITESIGLGKVDQVGIVVEDIGKAMRYYKRMFGIGPWYRPRGAEKGKVVYRGRESEVELDITLAFCGGVQVELIQTKGRDLNIYSEQLKRSGEGLHHLGFFVTGIEKKLARLHSAGVEPLQSGVIKSGMAVTQYAYLDTAGTGGVILELIDTTLMGVPLKMSGFMMKVGCLLGDAEKIPLD